jgi:hypothetical protein
MSALVRLYSHTGVTTAPVNAAAGRYTTDSVAMLKMPYLAREAITANTGTAQSTTTALTTNSGTKLVHVQIETGKTVAIEVLPPNRTGVSADSSSPRYAGDCTFEAGPNWLFSVLEIA